jgi:hypothetical protein
MPIPNTRAKARPAPPTLYHLALGCSGYARAPLVAAVVVMVRLAIPAEPPVILTGLVEPKLNMGRS